MSWRDWFRVGRFISGERMLVHDGPGGPLVPARLIARMKGPDERRIEVWTMEYDNAPGDVRVRAIPCQCERCQ